MHMLLLTPASPEPAEDNVDTYYDGTDWVRIFPQPVA